ncbi:MAG: large subunit ribosomal protein L29 [bacterium P3]|nr:MAG: large subunit ribosomal protein L29 [bacterium P3]KWW40112.1 MAG: large subunit ribosomal protein L29 [bacterium F083]
MKNQLVYKELSTAELREKLEAERDMYQKMLLNHAVSPLENPNKIKESRKNIARYLTELRAREIAEQK